MGCNSRRENAISKSKESYNKAAFFVQKGVLGLEINEVIRGDNLNYIIPRFDKFKQAFSFS